MLFLNALPSHWRSTCLCLDFLCFWLNHMIAIRYIQGRFQKGNLEGYWPIWNLVGHLIILKYDRLAVQWEAGHWFNLFVCLFLRTQRVKLIIACFRSVVNLLNSFKIFPLTLPPELIGAICSNDTQHLRWVLKPKFKTLQSVASPLTLHKPANKRINCARLAQFDNDQLRISLQCF